MWGRSPVPRSHQRSGRATGLQRSILRAHDRRSSDGWGKDRVPSGTAASRTRAPAESRLPAREALAEGEWPQARWGPWHPDKAEGRVVPARRPQADPGTKARGGKEQSDLAPLQAASRKCLSKSAPAD